jgi:hypothetical protein
MSRMGCPWSTAAVSGCPTWQGFRDDGSEASPGSSAAYTSGTPSASAPRAPAASPRSTTSSSAGACSSSAGRSGSSASSAPWPTTGGRTCGSAKACSQEGVTLGKTARNPEPWEKVWTRTEAVGSPHVCTKGRAMEWPQRGDCLGQRLGLTGAREALSTPRFPH